MAQQIKLTAQLRSESGRGAVKRMRAKGVVPAVVYGPHTTPLMIGVNEKELETLLSHATSENLLVDLQVSESGGVKNRLALIQDVQHHPVEDDILHVDFRELSATEKFRTSVGVRAIGEPTGVKNSGGILEFILRELRIECLPKDMPEHIDINVEHLDIGQSIHVREITPPPGVVLLDDKDRPVLLVAAPLTEEELTAATTVAAAGEAAEPEVIKAKKEEGEAGAAEGAEAKPAAGKAEAKPAAGKAEAKPAAGKAEAKPAAGKK